MTITFRVENGNGILPPKAAIITPDQLGALRDLLAEQSQRLGFPMLATIHETTGDDAFDLEARVCHLALAVVSKCFDHDPDVIAILDEAQYLGRRIRVWQDHRGSDIKMRLSLTPDGAPQLTVADDSAMALLAGLGLDRANAGVIAMTELRDRLTNPRIRRRLDDDPAMATCVETLTAMAALKPKPFYRPTWDAQPDGWRPIFLPEDVKPAAPRSVNKRMAALGSNPGAAIGVDRGSKRIRLTP